MQSHVSTPLVLFSMQMFSWTLISFAINKDLRLLQTYRTSAVNCAKRHLSAKTCRLVASGFLNGIRTIYLIFSAAHSSHWHDTFHTKTISADYGSVLPSARDVTMTSLCYRYKFIQLGIDTRLWYAKADDVAVFIHLCIAAINKDE